MFGTMKLIGILKDTNIDFDNEDRISTLLPILLQKDSDGNIPIISAAQNFYDIDAFAKLLIFQRREKVKYGRKFLKWSF